MPLDTVISCPHVVCGKRLKVDGTAAGKSARCHRCGTKFRLSKSVSADGSECILPTDPQPPDFPPPSVSRSSTNVPTVPLPERIGRFEVRSALGGGAFGVVFRAYDPKLEREVAVKVPKPGTLTTPTRVKRFLGDAKAAAQLRHPHIVPVFDVGEHDGNCFIASAYIDGRTLAAALDERKLDLRAKVGIVRRLAEALDYAHGQGVVHRDVKPDNVMLDAADQPHLIDFGLAKLGDDREGGGRAVMGTAIYMSPEQASGNSHDADARSDQYSLGVTLYELLGGRTPFSGPTNIVLFNVVKTPPPPLASLDPTLPLDLVLICQRAMAKDPVGRYATCGEFADDLRRWLDGETPRVRVLTRKERLKRWVKKEPRLAGAIGVAAAAVILAAVLGIAFGISSSRQARDLAELNGDLVVSRDKEEQERRTAEAAQKAADASALLARKELASANYDRAVALCEQGEIAQGMNWFLEAIREADGAGNTDLARAARVNLAAWRHQLNALAHVVPLPFHPLAVATVPDGTRAIVAGEFGNAGRVALVDPTDGTVGRVVNVDHPVRAVAFDPSGHFFVTADEGGNIQSWAAKDGTKLGPQFLLNAKVLSLAVHPSGLAILVGGSKPVANGGTEPTARLLQLKRPVGVGIEVDGAPMEFKHANGFEVHSVAFHPDAGTPLILTGSGAAKPVFRNAKGDLGEVRQFDSSTGELHGEPVNHKGVVRAVAYSPTGQVLLSGTGSMWMGEGRAWDVRTHHEKQGGVFPHVAEVNAVAYDRTGRFLLTAGQDRSVRVWDASTFRPVGQPLWHGKDVRAVAAAGSRILSVGDENAVRIWAVAPGPELAGTEEAVPDSPVIAAGVLPTNGDVWLSRMRARGLVPFPAVERRAVGGGGDLPPVPGTVRVMATRGTAVAVGGGEEGKAGFALVTDTVGVKKPSLDFATVVYAVGLSHDETVAAAGCDDGSVACWDTATGKELWSRRDGHTGRVYAATLRPDGKTLLTCAKDSTAALWDAATGEPMHRMQLPDIGLSATFDSTGKWFAVGYAGGCRLYSWDGSGTPEQPKADLPHQAGILFVAVDADGATAVTGGTDRRVRWWDLAAGKPIGPGWATDGLVRGAQFTGPGTVFVAETDHKAGSYRTYKLPTPAADPLPQLTAWVHRTSGMKLVKGVAEVIGTEELARPPVVTPTETEVVRWAARKPRPADPVPLRIAVGVPKPPEVVVKPPVKPNPVPPVVPQPPVVQKPDPVAQKPAPGAPAGWVREKDGVTITLAFPEKERIVVHVRVGDNAVTVHTAVTSLAKGRYECKATKVEIVGSFPAAPPEGTTFSFDWEPDGAKGTLRLFRSSFQEDVLKDVFEGEYAAPNGKPAARPPEEKVKPVAAGPVETWVRTADDITVRLDFPSEGNGTATVTMGRDTVLLRATLTPARNGWQVGKATAADINIKSKDPVFDVVTFDFRVEADMTVSGFGSACKAVDKLSDNFNGKYAKAK